MNRRILMLGVTALIVGVLVAGGIARAESDPIPVEGTETVTTAYPGRDWIDANNVRHVRGMVRIGTDVGQDADGNPVTAETVYIMSMNLDLNTGNGDYRSRAWSRDVVYGDLTGCFVGRLEGTITAFVMNGTYDYPRGFGGLRGWEHHGTFTTILGTDFVNWQGYLLPPDGGGNGKAAAVEATTLSAVKDLFR